MSALADASPTESRFIEPLVGFVNELKQHNLTAVIAGTGTDVALLWARAIRDSTPSDSQLRHEIDSASSRALEHFDSTIRGYVLPSSRFHMLTTSQVEEVLTEVISHMSCRKGMIFGRYPKNAINSKGETVKVNICIKESPDPWTTLSIRQPRNSTVTTFRIDTANPPRCIFRTLHEISLWYRQSTLETIHHWNKESPGWSPLMLFARIIKNHENARQILPTAFTSFTPSAYFDDECEYEATRDWMGKQIRDPSNEEIIKETCEILRGFYFQGSWNTVKSAKDLSSHSSSFSSAFTPISRNLSDTSGDSSVRSRPAYRRLTKWL